MTPKIPREIFALFLGIYAMIGSFAGAAPSLVVVGRDALALGPGPVPNVVAWGHDSYGQTEVPASLSAVVAVAAGYYHSLALKADGTVAAWGSRFTSSNKRVPAIVPVGLSDVVAIAAGDSFSLALKRDGHVVAWGDNSYGPTKVPAGLSGVVAITAGSSHALALKADGSVVAWGRNDSGQCNVSINTTAVAVAAGSHFSSILLSDGCVLVRGGYWMPSIIPSATVEGIQGIAAGTDHLLALKADGQLLGWSGRSYGYRESGPPAGLANFVAMASGDDFSMGLRRDGSVVAWTYPHSTGDYGQAAVPVTLHGVKAISARDRQAVAVVEDVRHLGCVNLGATGAASAFTLQNQGDEPLAITSVSLVGGQAADFVLEKSSTATSLAAKADAVVDSLGISLRLRPKAVGMRRTTLRIVTNDLWLPRFDIPLTGVGKKNSAPVLPYAPIFAEATSPAGAIVDVLPSVRDEGETRPLTAAFTPASGSVFPVGLTLVTASITDNVGLTTTGSISVRVFDSIAPVFPTVPSDLTVNSDTVNGSFVSYPEVSASDAVGATVTYSQASGTFFPIGDTLVTATARDAAGHSVSTGFHVIVQPPDVVVTQAGSSALVLAQGGVGRCVSWGKRKDVPAGLEDVVQMAAGYGHTLALKRDGSVVTWGDNAYGQLKVPAGLSDVVGIAASMQFSLALKRNGSVVAWGVSDYGALNVPTYLTDAVSIAAGGYGCMAIRRDGTVVSWGRGAGAYYSYAGNSAVSISQSYQHQLVAQANGWVIAVGSYSAGDEAKVPSSLANVSAVAAGNKYSLALTRSGSVVGWGSYLPKIPTGLSNVTAIAAGDQHSLALKRDGSVVAWGDNSFGQMTVPTGLHGVSIAASNGTNLMVYSDPVVQTIRSAAVVNLGGSQALPSISVRNRGKGELRIFSVSIEGADAADFILDASAMVSDLATAEATNITVHFQPSAAGSRNATLRLETNAGPGSGVFEIPLAGTGKANTAPVITVPSSPVIAEATSAAGASVAFVASVADEGEATLPPLLFSQASASLFPIGNTVVSASATDSNGLTATQTFTVRVVDTTAPVIAPIADLGSVLAQANGSVVSYANATVTDAVGVTSVTYSHPSGSLFPAGTTTVTVTATDAAGNAGTRTFLVKVGVIFRTPISPMLQEATGPNGAIVTYYPAIDYFSGRVWPSFASTPQSGTRFPIGDSTVTVSATESGGVRSSTSFVVRVRDTTAPSLAAMPSFTVPATLETGAEVTYAPAVATDVVGVTAITYSHPSGSTFPVGTTFVRATATDAAGNAGTRDFSITVTAPSSKLIAEVEGEDGWGPWIPMPGKVVAWGKNTSGQTGVPNNLANVKALAAGGSHTLALLNDGTVRAWGRNTEGQCSIWSNNAIAIAAGDYHSMVLRRDGTVSVYGMHEARTSSYDSYTNYLSPPYGLDHVVKIAASGSYCAALKSDGTVTEWSAYGATTLSRPDVTAIAMGGAGWFSVANDGSVSNLFNGTTPYPGLSQVLSLAVSGSIVAGLQGSGEVVAWRNSNSYSSLASNLLPLPAELTHVVSIAAGNEHMLALKADGSLVAWGSNSFGQATVPVGLGRVEAIAAGTDHSVALVRPSGGPLVNIGLADLGGWSSRKVRLRNPATDPTVGLRVELADDEHAQFSVEVPPPSILPGSASADVTLRFTPSVRGLASATLRVFVTGAVLPLYEIPLTATAWRVPQLLLEKAEDAMPLQRGNPQLWGWGSLVNYNQAQVPSSVRMIAAHRDKSYALSRDGSVKSWGNNDYNYNVPAADLTELTLIAASAGPQVGLKRDGRVVNIGSDGFFSTPVPVGLARVAAISVGDSHVVALKLDGSVVAWGNNDAGQATVPAGLSNVVSITAAAKHTLALLADGTVVAWGDDSALAAQVPTDLSDVITVSTSPTESLAQKADGTVVRWGAVAPPSAAARAAPMARMPAAAATSGAYLSISSGSIYGTTISGSVINSSYSSSSSLTLNSSYSSSSILNLINWNNLTTSSWYVTPGGSTTTSTTYTPTSLAQPANLDGIVQTATGSNHTVALTQAWPVASFGTVPESSTAERSFILHSTGTMGLRQLAATITGTNADQFSIISPPLSEGLASGESATVSVRFTPAGIGARTARLNLASNNLGANPSVIVLSATAAAPEIEVATPTVTIADGGVIDVGFAPIGDPGEPFTLTIRNTGNFQLAQLSLSKDGDHAGDFSFTPLTSDTIEAGSSQTFAVIFTPSNEGIRTATLHLTSNDSDEASYDIVITGHGDPISLTTANAGGQRLLWPASDLDFGSQASGTPLERSYTLGNGSSLALTGITWDIVGKDASQFTLKPALPSTLAAGESFNFTIACTATSEGSYEAMLRLFANHAEFGARLVRLSASVRAPQLSLASAVRRWIELGKQRMVVSWGTDHSWWALEPVKVQAITGGRFYKAKAAPGGTSYWASGPQESEFETWLKTQGEIKSVFLFYYGDALALKSDGTVAFWNRSGRNSLTPPSGLSEVKALATGSGHALALKSDGNVVTWGYQPAPVPVPAGLTHVVGIAAGGDHSLALKADGTVVTWGSQTDTSLAVPAGLRGVVAIAAGLGHSVALKSNGTVVAWGNNSEHQVDVATTLSDVIEIAAGDSWTVALKADGQLMGRYGPPINGRKATAISASQDNLIMLNQDGSVWYWGYRILPPTDLSDLVSLSSNSLHVAALRASGKMIEWGYCKSPQLDFSNDTERFAGIAVANESTAALRLDGTIATWATWPNAYELGVQAPQTSSVASIAVGDKHGLGLLHDGTVVAWGSDDYGQLKVPTGLRDAVAVAAAGNYSAALRENGTVLAWGMNYSGQCSVPKGLRDVAAIAAGPTHMLALKSDGTVAAWGAKDYQQCIVPSGLTGVVAISAGSTHSVALKRDGTVVAWGGSDHYYNHQTDVPTGLTGVTSIFAGANHTQAIVDPGSFGTHTVDETVERVFTICNTGSLPLTQLAARIEGANAIEFSIAAAPPSNLAAGESAAITLRWIPSVGGRKLARLALHSNNPGGDFLLDLSAYADSVATKASVIGSPFTYGPLTSDRQTGLLVQRLTFTNRSSTELNGLRLIISKLGAGVTVSSSSPGSTPGSVMVLYSNPIPMGETTTFELTYSNPLRRTVASIQPNLQVEALEAPEPAPGPVTGTLVSSLSVRATAKRPLLSWPTRRGKMYVVEYSDDSGTTWHSSVHRLSAGGTSYTWSDRGQPETQSRPVSITSRLYRVKQF